MFFLFFLIQLFFFASSNRLLMLLNIFFAFITFLQGVDNQGNHGKIRDLYYSGKVMEKSGNFVKISPNQGTLHFCLLNVAKKSSNRQYQKRKQEEKKIKQNLKRRKD